MPFDAKERDQDYCRVIIEAFGYLKRYLNGLSQDDFALDSKTQDAVAMRLQQILECAAKLSSDSKSDLKINWSALAAMRNRISHSYVDVDHEIIWQVIRDLEEFSALISWTRSSI